MEKTIGQCHFFFLLFFPHFCFGSARVSSFVILTLICAWGFRDSGMKWGCQHGYGNQYRFCYSLFALGVCHDTQLSKMASSNSVEKCCCPLGNTLSIFVEALNVFYLFWGLKSGYLVQLHCKNFSLGNDVMSRFSLGNDVMSRFWEQNRCRPDIVKTKCSIATRR